MINHAVELRSRPGTAARAGTRIESAVLAMVIVLMAESMLFAGLLGACVLVRSRSVGFWPPADLPRWPWYVTLGTTIVLLGTVPLVSAGRHHRSRPMLLTAAALGATFFAIQGIEWVRMLRWGGASGSYGAIFYSLIGVHGLHVLGGLCALLWASGSTRHPNAVVRLRVSGMYWCFVVAVWPVIYGLVYH